jgi:hypothetical protein
MLHVHQQRAVLRKRMLQRRLLLYFIVNLRIKKHHNHIAGKSKYEDRYQRHSHQYARIEYGVAG